jgi:hypothetical protein
MKPKKGEETEQNSSNKSLEERLKKLEFIEHIENLKLKAQSHKMSDDYDQAIMIADKIMRIAVKLNLPDYLQEQVDFIKSISQKVQKNYLTAQIKDYASWILKQYNKMIDSGSYYQAHDLVERFKESYNNLPYFEEIEGVREVLKLDQKEWLKFSIDKK